MRATLFCTTGATGDPKGVSCTQRQLVLHTRAVAAGLVMVPRSGGLKRDRVYRPITPLFHVDGRGFPHVATFLGLKQVCPGRCDPARLLALIAEPSVSFSPCVPTVPAMILGAAQATTDLSRWKVLTGASALSEGLARQARAHGIDVHAACGMSETCLFVVHADMLISRCSD